MSVSPTTKKFKKPSQKFDASVFERELSKGEAELEAALENLRMALYTGIAPDVLSGLLSKPHLFEYAFSILDDGPADILREELLAGFDRDGCVACPSPAPVLKRLSEFFFFLPYPSDDVKPKSLTEDYQSVSCSQGALLALATAGFIQLGSASFPQKDENEAFLKIVRRPNFPKQMKRAKRSRADTLNIERTPFDNLKEQVPSTQSEAQELALRLLAKQKELLGQYVDLLKDPALSETIRERYMPRKTDVTASNSSNAPQCESSDSPAEAGTVDDKPSAFPRIQPLKASLLFDSAKDFGEWRIYISNTGIKDLRTQSRDQKTFKIIHKKLRLVHSRELSNGLFSDDNQKRLKGPDKGIPIFEAKLTGDLRLVYQIDVVTDFESNSESQGIRVYGLFTHAQMDNRMWASLSAQLTTKGSEYRRRIQFRRRPRNDGDVIFLPQSWPDTSAGESVEDPSVYSFVHVDDLEEMHRWLVLEKYSTFSQALLNCILADKDASPVFSVSPYEREVIEHPSSCYVLGRSGTGKTTTMAFKIFGIERTTRMHQKQLESDIKPRQLFVTQSHVLARKVQEYYFKLSEFLSAVTERAVSSPVQHIKPENALDDPENDEDWRSDLPKRFSELQDSHFPLFLTFDKLCKLIAEDLGIPFARPSYTRGHGRAERRHSLCKVADDIELNGSDDLQMQDLISSNDEDTGGHLVTPDTFFSQYWQRFPQDLTKNLDPSLVFSEFLGVIKGSPESLKSESAYLSREAYQGLSERTRCTFATQRERIYHLFEKYLALKRQYGDYDTADRSHAIFQLMQDYKFSVDYLYVDEAQDNLIVDALLLRRLCRNPHGLFWAGDTAQTIAIGSSFRFDDLKAALYAFERELYPSASEKDFVQPSFFQLSTNYRSHAGIVNCARLIIELITKFWPYSIDVLQKEKGLIDGSKPIFFTGWNDETARYEQFLVEENGNSIEFGAQQCILVRNDRAREELAERVGKIGVILTLYESKGLEFDDVLLYNFFEDSPCLSSQWRVILNFLPEEEGTKRAAPRFDEVRHAGICVELKFLYVAITRARKNLWIMDRSDKGEPMKELLLQNGQVQICLPENAPKLAKSSKPEEWAETGRQLFYKKNYSQAMHCFERAGLHLDYAIAEAYLFRHRARNVPRINNDRARVAAFVKAGHAFLICAEKSTASQKKYYLSAAECFREAHANDQAASAYEKAEEYTNAATYYAKAIEFGEAVRVVRTWKQVDRDIAERIIGAARLHYIHIEKLDKAIGLFDSEEEGLEFLEECGFDAARASVYENSGRFCEAAELYFHDGHEQQAIQLLLKDTQNLESSQRAARYVLDTLWKQYSFGLERNRHDPETVDPLHLVRDQRRTGLTEEAVAELDMFDAIYRGDKKALLGTYGTFLRTRNNPQTAVLILDHLLTSNYNIDGMQEAIQYLEACLAYAEILKVVWNHPKLTENPRTQKLFGFRKLQEDKDEFLLTEECFLACYTIGRHSLPNEACASLNSYELTQVIKTAVRMRLSNVVRNQVNICTNVRNRFFGDLCLLHAIRGQCKQEACHRQHVDLITADMTWFSTRVRFHLLQILFLDAADFALEDFENKLRNKWLENLLNVLNPPLSAYGSLANIAGNWIPELKKSRSVVGLWIENCTYQIDRVSYGRFLNVAMEVVGLALWLDSERARKFIPRARFYTGERILSTLRKARSATPDLVRSMDMSYSRSIESGCTFIHRVIQGKLKIGVDNLCRIVEQLSAASILLYLNMIGSFHDCLLPGPWLLYAFPRLDFNRKDNTLRPTWLLVQQSASLASYLLFGSENAHIGGASQYFVKYLAVHKIFRAMCLVGYNTTMALRGYVLKHITELGAAYKQEIPHFLKFYLKSQSWSGLRRALEKTAFPSGLDKMFQLVQEGRNPRPPLTDAQIHKVTFKDKGHLLSLFPPTHKEKTFELSPHAPAFVPSSGPPSSAFITTDDGTALKTNDESNVIPNDMDENQEDDFRQDDHDSYLGQAAEAEILVESSTHEVANDTSDGREAAARIIQQFFRARRKERAARKLQHWYRAILACRAEMERPGIHGKRAKYYVDCLADDARRDVKWPSNRHRFLFLGLVPDLLASLDALRVKNDSAKEKAKRQLRPNTQLSHAEVDYEQVHLRITRANNNRKRLDQLKEQLGVTSEWHANRDPGGLRAVVQEIVDIADQLKITGDVRDLCLQVRDLVYGTKALEQRKKSKPKLNVDDDLDGLSDDISIVSD